MQPLVEQCNQIWGAYNEQICSDVEDFDNTGLG